MFPYVGGRVGRWYGDTGFHIRIPMSYPHGKRTVGRKWCVFRVAQKAIENRDDLRSRHLSHRQVLVREYCEDARTRAAMRYDELLEVGDLGECTAWRAIMLAAVELQPTEP